jgi:hypothetical protein
MSNGLPWPMQFAEGLVDWRSLMRQHKQAKGATLVSVTSVPGCKLESVCDLAVVLPLVRTVCQRPLQCANSVIQSLSLCFITFRMMDDLHALPIVMMLLSSNRCGSCAPSIWRP